MLKTYFVLICSLSFLLNLNQNLTAQEFKPHIGINLNFASQILSFSPIGLKMYGDILLNEHINLRTNFSGNFHSVNNTIEGTSLVNCFYTQLEESIIYLPSNNSPNMFYGGGIGYYSINNNEQSSHLQPIGPLNYDVWVGHDNYDSNIGFHFLIGKDTGKFILELKYTYTVFQHNRYRQESVNYIFSEGIVSKKETFHFFQFSISI